MFISIIMIIFMVSVIPLLYLIYNELKKYKNSNVYKIDKDTDKIIWNTINRMIQYESIYEVDSKIGNVLSSSVGATTELGNDELLEIHKTVISKVIKNMSSDIKQYLFSIYGEEWILEYIKIYSLSMLINYANLSVSSITMTKK